MQPERRVDIDLHPERRADDHEADDQDDEDDRTIAGIRETIIELATAAGRPNLQQPVEELSLAAAGGKDP